MLFAPDSLLSVLGLEQIRSEYRSFLGVGLVASASILVAQGIFGLARLRGKRFMKVWRETLHDLSAEERAYLASYVVGGETTKHFAMGDGVAGGLVAKKILYMSSNIGSFHGGFAHNIQPWARDYLEKHPELLLGASAPSE